MQSELDLKVAAEARAAVARKQVLQSELAEKVGETQQWVNRRLLGHVPMTASDVIRIADALDIAVTDLLPTVAA